MTHIFFLIYLILYFSLLARVCVCIPCVQLVSVHNASPFLLCIPFSPYLFLYCVCLQRTLEKTPVDGVQKVFSNCTLKAINETLQSLPLTIFLLDSQDAVREKDTDDFRQDRLPSVPQAPPLPSDLESPRFTPLNIFPGFAAD